jgi:uncharacterized protein (DUF1330 family)
MSNENRQARSENTRNALAAATHTPSNIQIKEASPTLPATGPGASASELIDHYMEHMYPAQFKRASHPVFFGNAVATAMDLTGIENAESWTHGVLFRYRSGRDVLAISTDPRFSERHEYKLAALDKTIAYPVEAILYPNDLRILLALVLFSLVSLIDLIVYRRQILIVRKFQKEKTMEVKNMVTPSDDQIKGFLEPGADGPIYMLNLLKFKDKAEYADGRQTDLTGEEAYGLYGAAVVECLMRVGGKPMFSARVERLMLGEVEELWDTVAIAMYPSRQAMMDMMQDKEYQIIAEHRAAGLAGQLNIETAGAQGAWLMGNQS